jgi:transposase
MKALSLDLRHRIADALSSGSSSQANIAARFAVSVPTVERIARKLRKGDDLTPGISTGRKPRIPADQWGAFEALVRSKNDWTLATLTAAWQEKTGVELSESAVARTLARIGFAFKKNAASPPKGTQRSGKRS